jgi:hypothetical protein
MKLAENPNEANFSQQFKGLLRQLLGRVPTLSLVSPLREVNAFPGTFGFPGRVAEVGLGSCEWTLLLEEQRVGQSGEARQEQEPISRTDPFMGVRPFEYFDHAALRQTENAARGLPHFQGQILSVSTVCSGMKLTARQERRIPGLVGRNRK